MSDAEAPPVEAEPEPERLHGALVTWARGQHVVHTTVAEYPALVRALEQVARERGRRLITLDASLVEGASGFYRRLGYHVAGDIPEYAYKPLGGLGATRVFWKLLDAREPPAAAADLMAALAKH